MYLLAFSERWLIADGPRAAVEDWTSVSGSVGSVSLVYGRRGYCIRSSRQISFAASESAPRKTGEPCSHIVNDTCRLAASTFSADRPFQEGAALLTWYKVKAKLPDDNLDCSVNDGCRHQAGG